jgi:hypothetical protein
MNQVRVSNIKARAKVQELIPFKGSNTFAEYTAPQGDTLTHRYVVYSYGYHFPMFIAEWLDGQEPQWYENADKYSRSTSKQFSQLHPHAKTLHFSTEQMKTIAKYGMAGLAVQVERNPYIFDPKVDRVERCYPKSLEKVSHV